MNKDNLVSRLTRVRLIEKVSTKTNNPYTLLELTFNQGSGKTYVFTTYVNNEQKTLIDLSKPAQSEEF